jgi:hypothetical protein
MTNTQFIREAVNANRALFEQTYNAGVALQNEAERAVRGILDKAGPVNAGLANEDVRENINRVADAWHQEQNRWKAYVDDGFDSLGGLLEPAKPKRAAKGKK